MKQEQLHAGLLVFYATSPPGLGRGFYLTLDDPEHQHTSPSLWPVLLQL